MTDRELLEAAARAAGMSKMLAWTPGATPWLRVDPDLSRPWNPLTDDGDALRLAVKLELVVDFAQECTGSLDHVRKIAEGICHDKADPCAATRRAIVLAAAELAKKR